MLIFIQEASPSKPDPVKKTPARGVKRKATTALEPSEEPPAKRPARVTRGKAKLELAAEPAPKKKPVGGRGGKKTEREAAPVKGTKRKASADSPEATPEKKSKGEHLS